MSSLSLILFGPHFCSIFARVSYIEMNPKNYRRSLALPRGDSPLFIKSSKETFPTYPTYVVLHTKTKPLGVSFSGRTLVSPIQTKEYFITFLPILDSLHEEQEKERRERRARRSVTTDASKTYDTCQLVLVADHLFFEHMGQRKSSTAINYMVCFNICLLSRILSRRTLVKSSFR